MLRFTIRNLLVLVGIVAVGIAAMRDASELTERAVFSSMFLVLTIALVGAIVTRGNARWVGFAVFGWLYAALWFVPAARQEFENQLLSKDLVNRTLESLLAIPHDPGLVPPEGARAVWTFGLSSVSASGGGVPATPAERAAHDQALALHNQWMKERTAFQMRMSVVGNRFSRGQQIGHAIIAWLMACFGACVGQFLTRFRRGKPSPNPTTNLNGTAASRAHALVER